MNKPLGYNNVNDLRKIINDNFHKKTVDNFNLVKKVNFVEENILIKNIDYYYTNPISRSSKVMSECRQVSKNFLFTGVEKAS